MAVRVDIPDIGPIEIQGAAEEATLKAILSEMKAQGSRPGGGGGGSGGGGSGLVGAAVGATKLAKSLNPLMIAVGGVSKVFGGIFRIAGRLAGAFSDTVDMFAKGRPSMVDFTSAVADAVPGAIKPFADALNSVIKLLYSNFTTFEKLTQSGIALGDQIGQMQTGFRGISLTAEEIGGALGPVSDGLASLGTASKGGAVALNILKGLTPELSMRLREYGITVGEQAEKVAEYTAQNALGLRMRTTNEQQLLNLSVDYQKNLRRLSEITGQQADDIAQGMAKANMNENFRNFLANMDGATRARIESIVNTAEAGFGDAGREAAMAAVLGIAPVTDGAAMLTGTMRGFNDTIKGSVSSAKTFTGSQDQYNKMLIGNFRGLANANAGFIQRTNRLGATLTLAADPMGDTFNGIARFGRIFGGTLEETESNLGKIDGFGKSAIETEQAISNFRNVIMDLVGIIGRELTPYMSKFATYLRRSSGALREWIDQFKKDVEAEGGLIPYLKVQFRKLFVEMKKAINDTFIGGMFVDNEKLANDIERSLSKKETEGVKSAVETGNFEGLSENQTIVARQKIENKIDGLQQGMRFDEMMTGEDFERNAEIAREIKELKEKLKNIPKRNDGSPGLNNLFGGGNPFENFGKGSLVEVHDQEAIVPKDSPAGNILSMMGGMMGDMKGSMSGGKMDIGKMMNIAQTKGAEIDAYAKKNQGALEAQGRGMVKNITGLSDEQLDSMAAKSVQSNNVSSSGTPINNTTGGMTAKLDTLIKINRDMLAELQSM